MSHQPESSSSVWASLQDILFQGGQLIDLRLALAIGLLAFLVAVGFDSAGNQAEAADLMHQTRVSPTPAVTIVASLKEGGPGGSALSAEVSPAPNAEEGRLATARRLRHGTLTSAVMTSSRLTQAHFFTDVASGQ